MMGSGGGGGRDGNGNDNKRMVDNELRWDSRSSGSGGGEAGAASRRCTEEKMSSKVPGKESKYDGVNRACGSGRWGERRRQHS